MSQPKIAIVCDWIAETGGAERVIHALHEIYPDAPIYTSTYEPGKSTRFENADIRTAWFQKLPSFLRKHQLLTIPRQWHFGRLKLSGYDVVISFGGAEAKAVRSVDGAHIDLCNTPTLYYWIKPENYLNKGTGGINPIWRIGLKILTPYAKRWDYKAAQRPDKIYAISTAVQQRIKRYYDRDSDIIFPPTDIERFATDNRSDRDGFVFFGRQVQHKRIDLAVRACSELGLKLIVVGDGPEHENLQAMAGPTIKFKTGVSDQDIVQYVANAEAFIFPNEEDFGIVAAEAQAAGTPVIAYRGGGSLDTVVEGVTGEFFDEQSVESLKAVLKDFNHKLYNRNEIIKNAKRFSKQHFEATIKKAVATAVQD